MERDKVYWTTKDGRKLDVDTMDERHVRNAFKMVLRNIQAKKEEIKARPYIVKLNGDMAQQFNDQQEYDEFEDIYPYDQF